MRARVINDGNGYMINGVNDVEHYTYLGLILNSNLDFENILFIQ